MYVREPIVTTACASRLDGRWHCLEADDTTSVLDMLDIQIDGQLLHALVTSMGQVEVPHDSSVPLEEQIQYRSVDAADRGM